MKRVLTLLAAVAFVVSTATAQPPREQRTPEERARMLTDRLTQRLDLGQAQQDSVYAINLRLAKQNQQLAADATREQRMEAFRKQQDTRNTQIKAVLTPQQQAEYDKMVQEMQQRGAGGPQQNEGPR